MTMCNYPSQCECLFCVPEQPAEKPTCDCATCVSGAAVNVQEWRKTDPRHEKIYQSMIASVRSGAIQVQGEMK